ncbi:anthranilate synthase component I [Halioxenophilus sp. WMMB6]|uniref:anthranilate synthase component I n=1 Tax=Halioxenophilus sp. WMMB6 TaxID=3073815 RepID=UPI00295E9F93|nr:anthranilate synthase component I [Halioxenophilus sp. WMMB6]
MTPQQFEQLQQEGYNRIPVYREVLADLDTPVSTYLKLAQGPHSYLFESVQGGEKWGRYSIIGLPAQTVLTARGEQVEVRCRGELVESYQLADPLAFVEEFRSRYHVPVLPGLPVFNGGLVGYFGYDCVRYVEPKLKASVNEDVIGTPDILLMVSEEVLVFDNLAGKIILIVVADASQADAYQQAQARLDELQARLGQPAPATDTIKLTGEHAREAEFTSSFGEQNFHAAIESIKHHVLAGDTMQVVLSQRLSIPFSASPLNLYRALRNLNPSPYLYFIDLGDHQVVGSSPEILARLEHGEVTLRPIAGTRRRGRTEEEDLALEQEMLADPKEIAEHLMLIDLGRNDVGRVAQTGSVKLTDKMVVERYSHVMHITSNVTGQIRPGLSAMDVLKASLPAGTLSGAPKIRAMAIIDELEQEKRGIYGGAVGYIGWNGNMDTAIAIRTAVIKDGTLYVQSGAGIVADSQPALEWKETMNKARAMFRAVDMVL